MPVANQLEAYRWNSTSNRWELLSDLSTPFTVVLPDGVTIDGGATTGLIVGASGNKLGFFGATAVVKPTALTAKDVGAINSGDATTDGVIGNNRARIEELETRLQSLGLLT